MKADAPELFRVQNFPTKFEPTQSYPSNVEIHSQQAFGKNNSSKLYTIVPVLTQIAVIMWKLGYLDVDHDKPETLQGITIWWDNSFHTQNLQRIDFSALRLLPLDPDTYNYPEEEKQS